MQQYHHLINNIQLNNFSLIPVKLELTKLFLGINKLLFFPKILPELMVFFLRYFYNTGKNHLFLILKANTSKYGIKSLQINGPQSYYVK